MQLTELDFKRVSHTIKIIQDLESKTTVYSERKS